MVSKGQAPAPRSTSSPHSRSATPRVALPHAAIAHGGSGVMEREASKTSSASGERVSGMHDATHRGELGPDSIEVLFSDRTPDPCADIPIMCELGLRRDAMIAD